MSSTRKHIGLEIKLAAALLTIVRPDENGNLVRVISHEEAKNLTAKQIISRWNWDHYPIRKADGGPDEPWNLEPRPVDEHQKKTREVDQPQMAKQRRLRGETKAKPKQKIPSRPFPRRAEVRA